MHRGEAQERTTTGAFARRRVVAVRVEGRHDGGAAGRLSWGGMADVPAGRRRERAAFPELAGWPPGCPWPGARAVAEAREERPPGCVPARPLAGRAPERGTGPVPALRPKAYAMADEPSAGASGGVAWTMP